MKNGIPNFISQIILENHDLHFAKNNRKELKKKPGVLLQVFALGGDDGT